ncbi:excinuclease ABC subunit A [Chromatiales bacterium (ex Bugula neritina AB1)]|nr:excinuclease ABC subunit A [Chromatiales bacterium (ex Bugula neritina AB1)]
MSVKKIVVKNATQNNLKNLDLEIAHGDLVVITGVSGSGKSSLAFDTIYAEGQRRYVETFSPYARQFLDRMDKPRVDQITGIPPAIAVDQTNPVRTSRSTVGTMTELNDHLKLLFARAASLYCPGCGRQVLRESPEHIAQELIANSQNEPRVLITFKVNVPENFGADEIEDWLQRQGYTRLHKRREKSIEVIQDRIRVKPGNRSRITEALEAAFKHGAGTATVYELDENQKAGSAKKFSGDFVCASCDTRFRQPVPSLFSFNSPMGACEACRGFGRTMGIDFNLVVPDESLSLAAGAIKPWQTKTNEICQKDLIRFARKHQVPTDVPWKDLSKKHQKWVLHGDGEWDGEHWYGVQRFFDWLETRSYKMHVRVLLSKYRSYTPCQTCDGARLKPEALWWRLGTKANANSALPAANRFIPRSNTLDAGKFRKLPGLLLHDIMQLPLNVCESFFSDLDLPKPLDDATTLLLSEIRTRLRYLCEVGLSYLTLDRQSRTLSGGEVQRINLTTALGTSLVNTLFVLDEPSIGLHPRDIDRVIGVLKRLRNAGNTLVVVEHDPQIILAADRVIDMGPGPGSAGGNIIYYGNTIKLAKAKNSLTADYLNGCKKLTRKPQKVTARESSANKKTPATKSLKSLILKGARENNLRDLTVEFPLQQLVCITGVSGSGKSTLVQDTLYRAICRSLGKPTEAAGEHKSLSGTGQIDDVVMVDQSPIGKSARSNPVSYTGAFDGIRNQFAADPESKRRGYTSSSFSFNSGMRCPACSGNGFEHVEMQFLSDVYIRCHACNGSRYRDEVLDIKLIHPTRNEAFNIAGILAMTIDDAVEFFAAHKDIVKALSPLISVGLGYLTLGQPVPTLSGGEAQRLKLAAHLAKAKKASKSSFGKKLFLFDEPTTGLHFDDIARLLDALEQLLDDGHSVIVVEHNLDIISNADWIIDLGPKGGTDGGNILAFGTPKKLASSKKSHTGRALRDYAAALNEFSRAAQSTEISLESDRVAEARHTYDSNTISVVNAREHNLKNINVQIPRDKFTVVTGLSGSGKSTLAFEILFNEGQRRYLESLNAYARQFVQPASRPDVDAIYGIPPTVAIEQRTSRGGRKSTVATMTEIYHFLRLLFVKLGTQHCPDCDTPIEAQSIESIHAQVSKDWKGKTVLIHAPLVVARKGYYTDLAKWAHGRGFDTLRVDGEDLATGNWPRLDRFLEHDIDLPVGTITISGKTEAKLQELLQRALDYGKGALKVDVKKSRASTKKSRSEKLFSTKRACLSCKSSFPELDPRLFSYNSKHGWCKNCFGTGVYLPEFDEEHTGEEKDWLEEDSIASICPVCSGQRLNSTALAVRYQKLSIAELNELSIEAATKWFDKLKPAGREADIARDILKEIRTRLHFLKKVGLTYLTLDRSAPSLSGGEAQRIRLASQLGSNLQGVCYILDEPTIGLHARDNLMLLDTLDGLRGNGNTVVVVEHDEDTIRRADHVIDMGPGAGVEGGEILARGTLKQLMKNRESVTGQALSAPLAHPIFPPRKEDSGWIDIQDANLNNLKNINARLPIGKLSCVSGVSGSGKSTLVRSVLGDNLRQLLSKSKKTKRTTLSGCKKLSGWEVISRVLEVDQTPIGKTPRSCPATYIGFWDNIRRIFADATEARIRGYTASRFSFNVSAGRCAGCDGQGMTRIEMNFLPDVRVPCDTCNGARFNSETQSVLYKGKSIGDVLSMSIDEAVDFFIAHKNIYHPLQLLQDIGLGYLTLGQPSPTLSGGEAQRIKLVSELAKAGTGKEERRGRKLNHTLYVLDEPTVGLHMADVVKLIKVLHKLVESGNTVVVVEHNLDFMANADWIIDMGPEGGSGGGRIVARGQPAKVAKSKTSRTAPFLQKLLS